MGGHGVLVPDRETLRSEARAAFRRDGFTVLACAIGRRAYDGSF
jgi:acetolactate synthase-1/2/3 large subunit